MDDGSIAEQIRSIAPGGVDAALELVGCSVLPDTLRAVRTHDTVCFTGALAGAWSIPDFSPFMIPFGVGLTSYGGEARDLPAPVFQRQLDAIADGRLKAPVGKIFHGLEQVRDTQADVENRTTSTIARTETHRGRFWSQAAASCVV